MPRQSALIRAKLLISSVFFWPFSAAAQVGTLSSDTNPRNAEPRLRGTLLGRPEASSQPAAVTAQVKRLVALPADPSRGRMTGLYDDFDAVTDACPIAGTCQWCVVCLARFVKPTYGSRDPASACWAGYKSLGSTSLHPPANTLQR